MGRRSLIKWAVRFILALLSINMLVRFADWGGRWEWVKQMLEAHPVFALIVRGPIFPLACLVACLVVVYGERYLKWPDIRAEVLRVELHPKFGLVPVEMMDQVQKIAGRETYDIDCDLMLEVFLVNHSETEVTIRNFSGDIKTKTKKIQLVQAEDFARYTLVTKNKMKGVTNVQTSYSPLPDLMQGLAGIPLRKGIGHQGWLGFTVKGIDRKEAEMVKFDLRVVDALGHQHPITSKKKKHPASSNDVPVLVGPEDG